MMNHKQQLIFMLDEAGLDYGYTQGDCVLSNGCLFRFYSNGKLREVTTQELEQEEYDY